MRKFRVKYFPRHNYLLSPNYLRSYADNGLLFYWDDKFVGVEWFIQCEQLENPKRFKVEQFTGTYDCNDRPIYEGDIIFHKVFGEQEVVFRDGAFKLKIGTYLPNHSNKHVFEVI
jgi:hypothetical protein